MPSFETYSTGQPLVSITFSYTDTTMTRKAGRKSQTVSITPEQRSHLDQLQANEQMAAASIFAEAAGWCSNWPGQET